MGSYLSEPIIEKVSTDESNDKLNCGASSMQGWRQSQEDAHNVILDFDKNTSLFAVYDGHGGHEVALYCSMKFPAFLKASEAYKNQDFSKALEEAFLGFDAIITKQEVIESLKDIVKNKDDESDEDEETVNKMYEEAQMPIEKVIERYNLMNPNLKKLKAGEKPPVSPFLKAKIRENSDVSSSSGVFGVKSGCENGSALPTVVVTPDSPGETIRTPRKIDMQENGITDDGKSEDVTSSSTPVKNGDLTKDLGMAKLKSRARKSVQQMYKKLLDFEEESEDEEDKTFEEPTEETSDEEVDTSAINNEDSSDDGEEDEEDEDEIEGEEEAEFARNMREEPGSDSGCTAVVALLKDNDLFVANAGDSRCIVCRNGKAVEMSIDHKPEDEIERERIVKAGGKVTSDGRVNGGLNLSRAIGDHAYKQNKELGDREQMITALPDVRTLTINPGEDEFMVLACDGIWNFMSSQEVVDFVRPGIQEGKSLSKICEEMFDHCLAPNTMGDGTGCDNMTAIIIQLKSTMKKRSASMESIEEQPDNKRTKTDNNSTSPKAAAATE